MTRQDMFKIISVASCSFCWQLAGGQDCVHDVVCMKSSNKCNGRQDLERESLLVCVKGEGGGGVFSLLVNTMVS